MSRDRLRAHGSDGNNQAQHPTIDFSHLSDLDKQELLDKHGYLHGIRIDGNDGPRKSIHRVAQYNMEGQNHSPNWIEEQDSIISEIITTDNSRDRNYVHFGWSKEAVSLVTPWARSRIAQHQIANQSGDWATKRTIVRRLLLDIPPEDLGPSPEFEAEIRTALERPAALDRFKALDRAFQRWGDVVPIVFELGALLAISDSSMEFARRTSPESSFSFNDLASSRTDRVNIQGGDTNNPPDGMVAWISTTRHSSRWAMARIVRVIPVTDLLPVELRQALEALYSTLLSYRPSAVDGNSTGSASFDGTSYAHKTIRSITIHADSLVDSLKVKYADGVSTERYGGPGGKEQALVLQQDEFIVEVVVWTDVETTCGIQFITNKGRISPHYGGEGGVPSVLNCEGGALSAFSGRAKNHSYWKRDMIYRVQTIWRHNLVPVGLTRGHHYSTYIGGAAGAPFNDWPYSRPTESAYISEIAVQGEKYIESIQATYTIADHGNTTVVQKPRHGATAGQATVFALRPDEYFVTVQGRYDQYIIQLTFVTNRGRSAVRGGSGYGTEFQCEAPRGMRLSFIMGKSSKYLHGLTFVWAPI